MKRWLLIVLVFLVPPTILIVRRGVPEIVLAVLSAVALGVFFLLWAGVGAVAWLALGFAGVILALSATRSPTALAA